MRNSCVVPYAQSFSSFTLSQRCIMRSCAAVSAWKGAEVIKDVRENIVKLCTVYAKEERCNRLYISAKKKAKQISVDEGGTVAVNAKYLSSCFEYIHNNPVKAGMVSVPESWPYSSYADYAGLRAGTLCNKELAYQLLGINESFLLPNLTLSKQA